MIGECIVKLEPGNAEVYVDGKRVDASVRVTFKRDGTLSTLKVGKVQPATR